MPTDWSFWEQSDREHLKRSDEEVVHMLDGCRERTGR